jgi:hypothetical protein
MRRSEEAKHALPVTSAHADANDFSAQTDLIGVPRLTLAEGSQIVHNGRSGARKRRQAGSVNTCLADTGRMIIRDREAREAFSLAALRADRQDPSGQCGGASGYCLRARNSSRIAASENRPSGVSAVQ